MKTSDLPFDRGQTASTGLATVDSTVLNNLEGKEYLVEDVDPSTGLVRTGRWVRLRLVRNVAGFALLPKRLVTFQKTAGLFGSRVDGYAAATAAKAYPVDEYLPVGGVANNDLFYIVTEGPALVLTDLAGGANNVINVGDTLSALTGATSGATTAGRVKPQDLTGATAPLGNEVQNRLGMALTAATTANTNGNLLVDIGKW